jgi:hypothetical protein
MDGNIIRHILGRLLVRVFRLAEQFFRKNQAQRLRLILSPELSVLYMSIYVVEKVHKVNDFQDHFVHAVVCIVDTR